MSDEDEQNEEYVFDFLCKPAKRLVPPTRLRVLVDSGATTCLISPNALELFTTKVPVRPRKGGPHEVQGLTAATTVDKECNIELLWDKLTLGFQFGVSQCPDGIDAIVGTEILKHAKLARDRLEFFHAPPMPRTRTLRYLNPLVHQLTGEVLWAPHSSPIKKGERVLAVIETHEGRVFSDDSLATKSSTPQASWDEKLKIILQRISPRLTENQKKVLIALLSECKHLFAYPTMPALLGETYDISNGLR